MIAVDGEGERAGLVDLQRTDALADFVFTAPAVINQLVVCVYLVHYRITSLKVIVSVPLPETVIVLSPGRSLNGATRYSPVVASDVIPS